jgi:hypothetical protein
MFNSGSTEQIGGVHALPKNYVCNTCGSTEITFRFELEWCPHTQRFMQPEVWESDMIWCRDCDKEVEARETVFPEKKGKKHGKQ